MKKIYSIVLMATALLIGTNVWAAETRTAGTADELKTAWEAAGNGDVIKLTASFSIDKTLWLGTTTMDDENPLSITLDLNGDTLTSTAQKVFVLTHGSLNVTGNGGIKHAPTAAIYDPNAENGKGEYKSAFEVFRVYGSTYKDVDAKNLQPGQNYYAHLTIGANVKLIAAVNGIVVDQRSSGGWFGTSANTWAAGNVTIPAKSSALYTNVYASGTGVAHGVCIDVYGTIEAKKYAIKANGNLGNFNSLKSGYPQTYHKQDRSGSQYVAIESDAKNYAPFIHIFDGAKLLTTETTRTDAVAAYGGGYARWLVEGNVQGSTAVYVKSGEMELKNATITSNFNGTASGSTADRGSGVDAGGSGLVVESSANYAGGTDVTIEGSTVITPTSGYALEEKITDVSGNSKVTSVDIEGGIFKEGDAGTITITNATAGTSVSIDGGTFEYANEQGGGIDLGGKNLVEFLTDQATTGDNTHTVVIATDDQGHQTIVISEGNKPDVANSVINAAENASINWQNASVKEELLTGNLKLTELQISQDYAQKLIIDGGASLSVDRVVLGAKAQIVVKAGGKFIVKGKQGIAAYQASNLILEASESAQALFLLDPAVESNTHPMAKVQYQSNSFYNNAGFNVEQFFGIPTYNGAVTNIETASTDKIYFDVWRNTSWDYIGAINVPGDPDVMANLAKFNAPFGLYAITSKNDADHKPAFTFSGELTGNMDHTFTLLSDWTTLGNAYMGPIDKSAIIAQLAAWNASYGTKQSVYTYDINPATGTITWTAKNAYSLPAEGIKAMQPLMFYNGSKVDGLVLDYSTLVWDPYVNPSNAPARQSINNITKAQINIAGENEADYTTIVADSELGDDRSFCAPMYNNPGLQLYVMGNEKYDIYAADEIENSYIGYRTVNAGMYTISFENVQGEDLVLVDLVNGARTNMTEGAIYTFHAEANESNDYRFQVVAAAKIPTSIDNTEADASAKKAGVYTLTGQYLGNASIFNALPAGVYVVDGVKKVK